MIIGLSGYARSGKDESAKALIDMGFERKAFADKLREFLYNLNPIVGITDDSNEFNGISFMRVRDVLEIYGWGGYKESPFGKEIRELLQRLGTDCGRNLLGDSVWINATLGNADAENIVVTDCRFPNEASAIKERGGLVVRINRPGVGPANDHPSETALDDYEFDYVIHNDRTIKDLHNAVSYMLWLYR